MKQPQVRKLNLNHTGNSLWQISQSLIMFNKLKIGLVNIDFALEKRCDYRQPQTNNRLRNLFGHQLGTQTTMMRSKSWQLPVFGQQQSI